MDRRHFVQAGMSSVLLPGAIFTAPAAAGSAAPATLDYFFVDDRFAAGALRAGTISPSLAPIRVQADVTPVWTGLLAGGRIRAPLALRGVTTESFFFRLKTLLARRVHDSQISRVGPDLHLWTIRTRLAPAA